MSFDIIFPFLCMLCAFTLASVFVTYFYLFLLCFFLSFRFFSSVSSSYKEQYWPRKRFHWGKISFVVSYIKKIFESTFLLAGGKKGKMLEKKISLCSQCASLPCSKSRSSLSFIPTEQLLWCCRLKVEKEYSRWILGLDFIERKNST